MLKKFKKEVILIAFVPSIFSFLLGYGVIILLASHLPLTGFNVQIVAITVGICLSITAEGTTVKLLMDYNQLNSKIGQIIIGAGLLDDILEVTGLSFILLIANKSTSEFIFTFPLEIIIFLTIIILFFDIFPKLTSQITAQSDETEKFTLIILIGLLTSILSQLFSLGPIIGAFIGGVIIHQRMVKGKEGKALLNDLKIVTNGLIIPFFFINIGLRFDFSAFANIGLLGLIVTIAIIGKLFGSMLVSFFSSLDLTQTWIIGWGMNARGAVELIIAEIARVNHLIPTEIYSAIVFMTVVTTLVFPFVLKYHLHNHAHKLGKIS